MTLDVWSLSIHYLYIQHLDHMLVNFWSIYCPNYTDFDLLDTKMMNHFRQSIDGILDDVFVTQTNVLYQTTNSKQYPWLFRAGERAKMRKKMRKVWGKMRKIDQNSRREWEKWKSHPPRTVKLLTALIQRLSFFSVPKFMVVRHA